MRVTELRLDIDSGWVEGAIHCPSPNCNSRPVDEISLLVIHNISLPPGEFGGPWIDDLFLGRLDPHAHPYFAGIHQLRVSAHCLIRRDGELVQYVPFCARAWHAGVSRWEEREACNDFSIGIELEGTDELPYSDVQYEVLSGLTQAISRQYPAITAERIVGHCDIAPGRKTDPGGSFEWPRYREKLHSE